jgi:hypothetical protein
LLIGAKAKNALTLPISAATTGLAEHHASPLADQGTVGEAVGSPLARFGAFR